MIDRPANSKLPQELVATYIDCDVDVAELEAYKTKRVEQITRSIEFPSEYHQAGLNILSYFGEIVRKRYKEIPIVLRIEQEGLTVRMIITSPDGELKECIEKTLEQYLMVITGDRGVLNRCLIVSSKSSTSRIN